MYPRDVEECRKAILKVEVNIGKWIRVDQQGSIYIRINILCLLYLCKYKFVNNNFLIIGRSFATNWHEKGYDSFWVPSNCGLEEWCIYDPKRIKVIDIIEPKYLSISNDNKDDQSTSKKPRREELRNSDVDSEESHSYLIAAIFVILIGICVKWCVKYFLY